MAGTTPGSFRSTKSITVWPACLGPTSPGATRQGIQFRRQTGGSGTIDSTEGVNAAAPRQVIGSRDGLRQTTIDLIQLVRQVETGIDIDGDGSTDLDGERKYYAGQSPPAG